MMSMEFFEEFSGSVDQMIVKGKRTKRPRPSSSASSGGGGVGGGDQFYNPLFISSPTTSTTTTTTEEDEDMANCLILLASGGSPPPLVEAENNKFNSRKCTEMASTKEGVYVYECKTCNKCFQSFQALGGHRASHKRPKPTTDIIDKKRSPPRQPRNQEEEGGQLVRVKTTKNELSNKSFYLESKGKIHECSICGSEFGSGQALGGHMRRHRSSTSNTNSSARTGASIDNDTNVCEETRNMFVLDLNMPAPPENEHQEASFYQFSSNQRPRNNVFSAAAPLVDCHY